MTNFTSFFRDPDNWKVYMDGVMTEEDMDSDGVVSWSEFWAKRRVEFEKVKPIFDLIKDEEKSGGKGTKS